MARKDWPSPPVLETIFSVAVCPYRLLIGLYRLGTEMYGSGNPSHANGSELNFYWLFKTKNYLSAACPAESG